ncbi:hypothetical protein U91I_00761 [alpha proteobacterium U9-1i]|nr:hypothetical protein U91I_00761 [alpha proteobacterium U9-1i]
MDRMGLAIGLGRALAGWLSASLAGAVSGLLLFSIAPLGGGLFGDFADGRSLETAAFLVMFIFVFALAASAIVAPIAVLAIRSLGLPRPWTEMAVAALLAAVLPFAINLLTPSAPLEQALAMLAITVPSGAVAGGVYWIVAVAPLHVWSGAAMSPR